MSDTLCSRVLAPRFPLQESLVATQPPWPCGRVGVYLASLHVPAAEVFHPTNGGLQKHDDARDDDGEGAPFPKNGQKKRGVMWSRLRHHRLSRFDAGQLALSFLMRKGRQVWHVAGRNQNCGSARIVR